MARLVAGLLSLVLVGTSGWGWYLGKVAEAAVNRTDAIPTDGNADTSGTGEAMNLLLVGTTAGQPQRRAARRAQRREDSGTNTDTMILVHIPADGSKASFVSFPGTAGSTSPGTARTS